MKNILFRFPLRYYLNPVSLFGVAFMAFIEYSRWVKLFEKIATFEQYNVTHWHNHFELIPSTIFMTLWTILNVLLYPYVFDAILKLAARVFKSGVLTRGMIKNSISLYQAEIERGDIYLRHRIEYGWHGYPTGLVPEFDLAKPRAFDVASQYFILRLAVLIVLPTMALVGLLWGGWMLSAVIGWIFALLFDSQYKRNNVK